jgi:phage-related protein
MVTDSLFVSLMSSISAMSFLKRSKVPLSDLEERVIKIGVKEVSIYIRRVIYRYLFSFAYFKLTSLIIH